MANNKVIYGNKVIMDISDSDVTPENLLLGVTAYAANGEKITGVVPEMKMTINVIVDEPMIGHTLRAYNLDEEYTKVVTSTLTTFNVMSEGLWTVEDVNTGVSAEIEVVKDYDIEFGMSYRKWLQQADITDTFGSLENVLTSEVTVRKLMTIHASADYLYAWCLYDSSILNTIMSSKNGAKWLGLRDYICDKFMANSSFKNTMLNSTNWEYILKDHVPVMTSNTAPYGTASAYQVFDGNSSTTARGSSFSYAFTNPIKVDKMTSNVSGGQLQCSDDGSTWGYNDGGYHIYWRAYFISSKTVHTVQFYGRALNVSVPIMTSNTSPYGEASASTESELSGVLYHAWKAFDGLIQQNNAWDSGIVSTAWLQYKFDKPIMLRQIYIAPTESSTIGTYLKQFEIQASNDGVKFDILYSGEMTVAINTGQSICFNIASDIKYQYFRLNCKSKTATTYSIREMKIYGLDYSEREFESGSSIHYLYDHGVELETIEPYSSTGGTVTKKETSILLESIKANDAAGITTSKNIQKTAKLMRVRVQDYLYGYYTLIAMSSKFQATSSVTASKYLRDDIASFPNNIYLDISNVAVTQYPNILVGGTAAPLPKLELKEWWLE